MKAFEIGTLPSGKRNLKIVPYEVHHLEMDEKGKIRAVAVPEISPYRVKSFLNWFEIPCGYCDGCRIDRSREWANRCMLELQYHDSAYFITLTYNDDHVPVSYYADPETGEAQESLTLCKRDWQLFMKRLRKAFPDDQIRFYACGEYGSQTFRPHYHAIVFGLHLHDLVPVQDVQRGELGYQYFSSESLQRCWSVVECSRVQGEYDSPCTPNFVRKIVRQNEKSWLFRLKGSNGRHLVDMRNRQSSPPLGGQGFERFFGRHLVDML